VILSEIKQRRHGIIVAVDGFRSLQQKSKRWGENSKPKETYYWGAIYEQNLDQMKYSKVVDEPVKHILDSVHHGHIEMLTKDLYGGDASKIPVIEYLGGKLLDVKEEADEIEGKEKSPKQVRSIHQLKE
jgi:hypothetical protein